MSSVFCIWFFHIYVSFCLAQQRLLPCFSMIPFLHLCPVQPGAQVHRPLAGSQRALFSQMHFIWHFWPKRPLGHTAWKKEKKDWSTTAICSKLHEKSTKFPWHFFTAIQPWVNTEEPAVSGSGVIFLLPVKTWLQAYEFVENYPSDFYHVPSLHIQTASF